MSRYIIADSDTVPGSGWTHLFPEGRRDVERETRFVWDTDTEKLLHLDIRRNSKWQEAGRSEIEDLEDSLKNANEDALENPDNWGLTPSDELPEWFAGSQDHSPGL